MSINMDNLETVRSLCVEVAELSDKVRGEMVREGQRYHERWPVNFPEGYVPATHYGSPLSGKLRRRSMDLTRALAELRR